MKVVRILERNIRDSFRSIFRNFSLSLASISCITITLLVVSISIILSYNVNNFTSQIEKDVTIVTFLDVDVDKDDIQDIKDEINSINYVDSIEFKGKQEITDEMMNSSDTYKNIMENMSEKDNPLQDTYLVKVSDINHIEEVANQIKEIDKVSIVKYGEGMVEQLVSAFTLIKRITIGIVIALVVVTAFLISNTIKITISSRKREIEIMRLVGASNLNIKIPFILEGLFLGVIGAIVPILVTCYGYVTLYGHFKGQLFSPIIKLIIPVPFIYQISGILLLIGIVVGMLGSAKAVRKYLKI